MFKLEYQFEGKGEKVVFELADETTLSEMVEVMERFLRAATYCFDGHLEIVEPIEDMEVEDESIN